MYKPGIVDLDDYGYEWIEWPVLIPAEEMSTMPKNVVLPPKDNGRPRRHDIPTQRPAQPKPKRLPLAQRDPRRRSG
jgi:hypothetical protein